MDYQADTGGGGNYGGGGGGGFDNSSGGGFNSGGGGTPRARKAYDEQTLIPVTARMILQSQSNPENNLALADGREMHHVKLIGAVRSYEEASTNLTLSIEDGTGLVDVKQWLDANDIPAVAEMRGECKQDHIYVKIIGQVKDYDGRKTLVAHTVRRLSTLNELTYHMLEVVYSAEKFQRKESIVGGAMPQSMAGGVGFGAGVGGGGAPVMAQASNAGQGDGLRDEVLNFIRTEGSKLFLCLLRNSIQHIHCAHQQCYLSLQTIPSMVQKFLGVFSFSLLMEGSRKLRFVGLSKICPRKDTFIPLLTKIITALQCKSGAFQ